MLRVDGILPITAEGFWCILNKCGILVYFETVGIKSIFSKTIGGLSLFLHKFFIVTEYIMSKEQCYFEKNTFNKWQKDVWDRY